MTLMVKGTLQSEFLTMFWPMRLTYSAMTGSVMNSRALLDLVGVGLAHLDFGVGGVPVAQAAAADVAIADGVDVFDAAGLDFDHVAADGNDFFRINILGGDVATHRRGSGLRIVLGVLILLFLVVLVVSLRCCRGCGRNVARHGSCSGGRLLGRRSARGWSAGGGSSLLRGGICGRRCVGRTARLR